VNLDTLLEAGHFRPARLEFPDSWIGHIPFAAWLIKTIKPLIFVELGTHSGNSYLAFCQAVKEGKLQTKCYAVDTWNGDEHSGFYGEEVFIDLNSYHEKHYAIFSSLLRMTFDEAAPYFADGSIELLHIDGLHTYKAVKHDFETWLPKLAHHAIVIIHDANVRERGFGIWRFWLELCQQYPLNFEFVHSHGLGILQLSKGQENFDLEWLQPDFIDRQMLKEYFADLGQHVVEQYRKQEIEESLFRLRQASDKVLTELQTSQAQLADGEQAVQALKAQVVDGEQAVQTLTAHAAEREQAVQALTAQAAEREQAVQTLTAHAAEREQAVQALTAHAAERDLAVKTLSSQLAEKELAMQTLSAQMSEQVAEKDRALQLLSTRHGDLEQEMVCQNQHMEEREKILQDLNSKLLEIYGSTAWRIIQYLWRIRLFLAPAGSRRELFGRSMVGILKSKSKLPIQAESINIQLSDAVLPVEQPSLESLRYQPLISVLIPVYNTPVNYLIAAIDSVRHQFYPHWEICICDDASSSKATRNELRKIARSDARIKVVFSQTNGGISVSTNKASEIAQGEFFAFLDHDDELTANALYEMVKAINEDESADVLYSDEDKIDANGIAHEPFFKPDWSAVFFRSVMYVGHLLVVKRGLFQRVNGMNSQFDGVQDYEFMLRVSEITPRVKHVPLILYHWRKIPGSIAMGIDEKGDKIEFLQARAVNEHLSRLGILAIATRHPRHRHRVLVQPKPRKNHPLVSIIILTKDAPQHIGRCLQSVFENTTYPNYEVIIVDNGTTDPDALRILKDNLVKVVSFQEKFNYSKANNAGVQYSQGEFLILLNNDTEVITPDWIEQLLFYCELPDVGAVGPLLLYPDRTVQHAGVVLGFRGTADHVMRHFPSDSDGYAGSLSCPREVSAVTGACLMIKRSDYLNGGGLLEYYESHYQDVDLCLRLLANGKHNLYVSHAVLIHYEGSTRGKFYDHMDRALLLDTWEDLIAKGDSFYNPNFTLANSGFYTIK
jgi:GT2 family glycosyltransferase